MGRGKGRHALVGRVAGGHHTPALPLRNAGRLPSAAMPLVASLTRHLPFRPATDEDAHGAARRFRIGLARAFGGAVIFALPLLMTMEMWRFGLTMPRGRLALLLLTTLPMLVGLSRVSGFELTRDWLEDVIDAFVAYAVALLTVTGLLYLLGELRPSLPLDAIVGKVTLQAIPASMGALLAQSQLGGVDRERDEERGQSYWVELLLMAAGALFLTCNLAPTEEMILIAFSTSKLALLALALLSILVMHAFVYAVGFRGQEQLPEGMSMLEAFFRLTITGYALVLLISAYVLWTFGRFDGTSVGVNVASTVILALPGAVGAAAARLIL